MRKIFFAVIIIALFSGTVFAADSEIIFYGNIILNGEKINGSAKIPMPKPTGFVNQDNAPMTMAVIFRENGYDKAKPVFTIKTSESFTVSGPLVNGVYRLRRTIKKGSLNPIGGDNAPYKIPARPGEYYIGINLAPDEIDEDDDAGFDQFIKIAVVNDSFSESETKFPALGICTASNVRLRKAPGTASKVIGRAEMSDRLIVLGTENLDGELWLMIENPSGRGRAYIAGSYVEVLDNEAQAFRALINVRQTFGTIPAKTRILLGKPLRTIKGSDDDRYDSKLIYKGCEFEYTNDRVINIEISQRGWKFAGLQVGDSIQKLAETLGRNYSSSYESEEGILHYEYDLYPDQVEVLCSKNRVTYIGWRIFGDPADYE